MDTMLRGYRELTTVQVRKIQCHLAPLQAFSGDLQVATPSDTVASGELVNGFLQRVQDRVKALQVWDEGSLWEAVVCASGIPDFENVTNLSWWLAATTSFLVGDDPGEMLLDSSAQHIT